MLKNMSAEKQWRVLTLFWLKSSDKTICPGGLAFLTSPCHTWILPDNKFPRVLQPRTPMQDQQRVAQSDEQRMNPTPISQVRVSTNLTTYEDLRRMSDAPPIMRAPNSTMKQAFKSTKQVHRRLTRNNVPITVSPITRTVPQCPLPPATEATPVRQSPRLGKTAQHIHNARLPRRIPKVRFVPIAGQLRNHNIISQQASTFLTKEVWNNSPQLVTPENLRPKEDLTATNLEHLAMPMVHPTTGELISSYKKLMNDPATIEIWQTAFGKDFGGMVQGDNIMGQKGTNAIFVMTCAEILLIPTDQTITYARVVVNFRPQRIDPHCIQITAGGNLLN